MRNILSLAVMLALPAMASANDKGCVVSFSGAQQNVCEGTATAAAPSMHSLMNLAAVEGSSLRIVKFDGAITEQQRAAVEKAGARIIDYAPHYAYIVRMPAHRDAAMRQVKGVLWSGPMLPALKVDPNIFNELQHGGIVKGLDIDTLEITFDSGEAHVQGGQAGLRNDIARIPGLMSAKLVETGGEISILAKFRTDQPDQLGSAVEQLALRDDVLSVGLRKPVRTYNSQGHWLHQSNSNSPGPQMPVWDRGVYGCGQTVGILDTGLWMDNVAFKDASQPTPINACKQGSECPVIALPNYLARKVVSYYKWSDLSGGSWDDDHGHGTHVAGSVAGNNNVANPGTDCENFTTPGGNTDLDGMAPGAKLVMQESGSNLAYLNSHGGTIYHAADVAYQNGARIHNDSWGGGCTNQFGACISNCTVTYDTSARNADRIAHDRSDLLVVFAAGNDATACANGNNVGSPGNAKNVLTIGATNRGTGANNMAGFSSRGPTTDSRTKPDLAAQGSGIMSADRNASGTRSMSGTSMASPTAAGLAALVRDYLARGFYPSGEANSADAIAEPSGALVKAIMTAGAYRMTGSGAGANPSQSQGFGRILLDDSLHFDGDASKLFIHDAEDGLQTGGADDHAIDVVGGERLTIALSWTDAAAAVGASPATVNSLRLEVKAPNGDIWTQKLPAGYNVNNANPTQGNSESNYDDLNNIQRIRFDAPTTGTYEIRVRGINVPSGPQTYALAATGNFEVSMEPTFSLSVSPGTVGICAGEDADYDIGVRSREDFDDPVMLAVSGLPGAASGDFSVNPVIPADPAAMSLLSITNTASLSRGSHSFQIDGLSDSAEPILRSLTARLNVSVGVPVTPALVMPANGMDDVARQPTFSWAADEAAENYIIEVATDSGFANIVASGTTDANSWSPGTPLTPMTTYYWRVRAGSACGDSVYSTTWSFTTGVTFPEPYCPVTFPSGVEPISRVKFSGFDNPSAVSGGPAHQDFLGVPGGLVEAGSGYQMVVEGNTAGNYTTRVNAFIDWNRDGTFQASEGYSIGSINNSTGADGKQAIATITVPASATPGPVRMRVLKKYNTEATACNSSGYGQAEDYTLMVMGETEEYTVGGTVSGLTGNAALSLNDGPSLQVVNGTYTFPDLLADGTAYTVTVTSRISAQCTLSNDIGTIAGADVTNVDLTCVEVPDTDIIFQDGFEAADD